MPLLGAPIEASTLLVVLIEASPSRPPVPLVRIDLGSALVESTTWASTKTGAIHCSGRTVVKSSPVITCISLSLIRIASLRMKSVILLFSVIVVAHQRVCEHTTQRMAIDIIKSIERLTITLNGVKSTASFGHANCRI